MNNYIELIREVKTNVLLKDFTNTRTGGRVTYMFYPHDVSELKKVLLTLISDEVPFEVLGEMTNVAIAEGQLDFVVINMMHFERDFKPRWNESRFLTVSASQTMKELSVWAYKHDIKGLAWMEGIPGTVGAGIFMNAGFLVGQDVQTYMVSAEYLDLDDMKIKTINNQDLHFRYRYSLFHEMKAIILKGTFLLQPLKKDLKLGMRRYRLKRQMKKYHKRRANNQPLDLPSAGTVFVPPFPWHVGGMIREQGFVGYQIGGARISEKSPGFIVNTGNMTGENYFDLVKFIQKIIFEKYKIKIYPEVRLISKQGDEKNRWIM